MGAPQGPGTPAPTGVEVEDRGSQAATDLLETKEGPQGSGGGVARSAK